jgi:hypothetical protein
MSKRSAVVIVAVGLLGVAVAFFEPWSLFTSSTVVEALWLSEKKAGGNWFKYGGGRKVQLGELKANRGSHNYAIPAGADLDGLRSVVIWCKRFHVAFGSAPLTL